MGEREVKIFATRQEKLTLIKGYLLNELFEAVPHAFIHQTENIDYQLLKLQLEDLR